MNQLLNRIRDKFVSKWLILVIDLVLVIASFTLATLIRFNFDFQYVDAQLFKYHLALVLVLRSVAFIYFRTYSGIIRHTSFEDALGIMKALSISSFELFILSYLTLGSFDAYLSVPYSIILIDFFVASVILVFSRIMVKNTYDKLIGNFKAQKNVVIYGAGHLGQITKNTLLKDRRLKYNVMAFVDDNPQLVGKSIEGVIVISQKELLDRIIPVHNKEINKSIELIFAIQSISTVRKAEILDTLIETGVQIKALPPVRLWMNGELSTNQIKDINIEDLLEREPIQLNNRLVASYIKSKVVLITGAAGSIGSEIVRQVVKFNPERVILFDQAESGIYDLESELVRINGRSSSCELVSVVGNVCDEAHIAKVFKDFSPSIVFHTAAYKHVPLMEKVPHKAVEVNVFGTKKLADLSVKSGVSRFVFVSTDKAVNPTNVMGASKRLAEMYVQALSTQQSKTRFITTRFGNVLGSNGSVIPLFRKQIENGGPVTVTDKRIIRYFMTIPEACQLVLEAGTMGKGGEIFVFEMGQPVRIFDLAKRMIKLSGLVEGEDIKIEITGLRPGEKLYEELLNEEESTLPTHHPKIMIAKVRPSNLDDLIKGISDLNVKENSHELVSKLKNLVPEFISKNSEYEVLDELSRKSNV